MSRYGLIELPKAKRKRPMDITQLKPGMRVYFIDERLNVGSHTDQWGSPESGEALLRDRELMVVVVRPDNSNGKKLGVVSRSQIKDTNGKVIGHSCDGLVPHGHGWWLLPEQVYTPEEHQEHVAASEGRQEEIEQSNRLVKEFLG